jgi:hypothetical protein
LKFSSLPHEKYVGWLGFLEVRSRGLWMRQMGAIRDPFERANNALGIFEAIHP